MSDESALLAAICANPADDTPRLVYADWLDENAGTVKQCSGTHQHGGKMGFNHGVWHDTDPRRPHHHCDDKCTVPDGRRERAEFIRVQVELARMEPDTAENCVSRWGELSVRERELFNNGGVSLSGPHRSRLWSGLELIVSGAMGTLLEEPRDEDDHGSFAVWRRGFLGSVTAPWGDWFRIADALYWCPEQTVQCRAVGPDHGDSCFEGWVDAPNPQFSRPCRACEGTGLVPRTRPATVQPLTRVTLTTLPNAHVPDFNAYRQWKRPLEWGADLCDSICAEWESISFKFPHEDRPRPALNSSPT